MLWCFTGIEREKYNVARFTIGHMRRAAAAMFGGTVIFALLCFATPIVRLANKW